jgi:hypothetical protein
LIALLWNSLIDGRSFHFHSIDFLLDKSNVIPQSVNVVSSAPRKHCDDNGDKYQRTTTERVSRSSIISRWHNRPLEDWGKLIGDVLSAGAILDRFLSNAEVIEIKGESYRMRGPKADSSSNGPSKKTKTGQTRKPGISAEPNQETT